MTIKDADLPVHPHSLISAFVIYFLEIIIYLLDTHKLSIVWLVSVAEQGVFEHYLVATPEDKISCVKAFICTNISYWLIYMHCVIKIIRENTIFVSSVNNKTCMQCLKFATEA